MHFILKKYKKYILDETNLVDDAPVTNILQVKLNLKKNNF